MSKPFKKTLYRGYSTVSKRNTRTLFDVELVKQDLINHFSTRKGERARSCTFGSIIEDLVFEIQTPGNVDKIINEVKRIVQSDVRVNLVNIVVNQFEHGVTIDCVLDFVGLDIQDVFVLRFDKTNGLMNNNENGASV